MSLFDTLTRYVRGLFWWELLPLAQRPTLTGFVLLVPDRYALLRLLMGLMVVSMCAHCALKPRSATTPFSSQMQVRHLHLLHYRYLVVLLLAQPYRHRIVNVIAFGAQLSLVCVFGAALIIKVYYHDELSDPQAFTGFSSGYEVVAIMLAWNSVTLALAFVLTSYQAVFEDSLPTIRRVDNGHEPELVLADGFTYHLFLSHGSALDQKVEPDRVKLPLTYPLHSALSQSGRPAKIKWP